MTPEPSEEPAAAQDGAPALAPMMIEEARSSRSKCRTCRRKIDKGKLRIGVLLEGPYGTGYLWHHLTCAAKRRADDVEEAYANHAWADDLDVPPIEELRKLREKAEEERKNKKEAPFAERAPSGRSKCKHCDELIQQGAFRVALLR
jgi:poly [ADP-ribose] polymerase